MALYAKSTIELELNITSKGALTPLDKVTVTIKNNFKRFEREATITGTGTCSLVLSTDDTQYSGNYYVQPIVVSGGSEVPGSVRMFELKDRL